MAGVDEAEARRAPQGDDDTVDDAVQRGVRGRQRLVDRVGGLEVVDAVLAPGPGQGVGKVGLGGWLGE